MYSGMADKYDRLFGYKPNVVEFISSYMAGKNSNILDIGCGTGRYTAPLSESYSHVVGIDPDRESIRIAQERASDALFYPLDLFSFETGKLFDLIFCIGNTISHVSRDDIARFVDRVYSLLKPGGIWILHTINWDYILTKDSY